MKAPILFVAGERDDLCPAEIVREAATKAPNAKLSIHDVSHFDIYLEKTLQVCSSVNMRRWKVFRVLISCNVTSNQCTHLLTIFSRVDDFFGPIRMDRVLLFMGYSPMKIPCI